MKKRVRSINFRNQKDIKEDIVKKYKLDECNSDY